MTYYIIELIIHALAFLLNHHHHVIHAVNYALYPCAAGHPPVNPDWGACQGTKFIAS